MAFTFTEIGPLVSRDPKAAAEKLADLLAAKGPGYGNLTPLAEDLGISYRTLSRWLSRLGEAGYDVQAMAKELAAKPAAVSAPPP